MKTNCINCGAPLNNNKCDYCGTKYTLDEFGQINEYKVKLNIMGQEKEFYISEIETHCIYSDAYRDINGKLARKKICNKAELKLIEM